VAPHKLTLGEWLDTWLWEYKKPSVRAITFDSYEMLIRCHLKPMLGHIALKDIRPEHLQHFYNEKMQHGSSTRTVPYLHTILQGALTQAEKHQLIARNVVPLTEPPRKQRKEMHTLSLPQVSTGLLPVITHDRLFAAIFLMFGTGLRRSELLGLRWKDMDIEASVLHVRQTLMRVKNHEAREKEPKTKLIFQEPKTASSRRAVPIPDECIAALRRHKAHQAEEKLLLGQAYEDHGLVFCRPN